MPSAEIYDKSGIEAEIARAQETLRTVDESLRPGARGFRGSGGANFEHGGPGVSDMPNFRRNRNSFGGETRRFERDDGGDHRFGGGRGGRIDHDDPELSAPLGARLGARSTFPAKIGGRAPRYGVVERDPLQRGSYNRRLSAPGADRGGGLSLNQRFSQSHNAGYAMDDDEDMPMTQAPVLSSAVVMPIIDTKSRDEAIKEMETTEVKEVKTRNKRLFANLLGTLSGFAKDSRLKRNTEQEKKQKEVEERLAKEKREELERRKGERADLMGQRREAQAKLQTLNRKKAYVQIAEREESRVRMLQNFIQTTTYPPIFYLPAKHTLRTLELLKNTERKLEDQIASRRHKLESDLKMVEESERNKQERNDDRGFGQKTDRKRSGGRTSRGDFDDDEDLEPGEVPIRKRRRDDEATGGNRFRQRQTSESSHHSSRHSDDQQQDSADEHKSDSDNDDEAKLGPNAKKSETSTSKADGENKNNGTAPSVADDKSSKSDDKDVEKTNDEEEEKHEDDHSDDGADEIGKEEVADDNDSHSDKDDAQSRSGGESD